LPDEEGTAEVAEEVAGEDLEVEGEVEEVIREERFSKLNKMEREWMTDKRIQRYVSFSSVLLASSTLES